MAHANSFDFYCIEVLTGKTPVKKVYESDKVLAFYHTKPKYSTHVVIIPKEHVINLISAKAEVLTEIVSVAKSLMSQIDIEKDGGRLVTNLGSFQDTPHLHFHLISDGNYQNLAL